MKNQRGYVLVELMAAIAISAILAGLLSVAIQQIVTIPEQGDARVEASHAMQNTIHWVGQDAGSAKSAVGGGSLILNLPDESVITYARSGTDLYRTCGGVSNLIAMNVTDLSFTVSGRVITMSITASPESRWNTSENQTYQVVMRPSGI